jgi:DNA-binding XRE family transcriptional regulator
MRVGLWLSQTDIARTLGVSRQTVAAWEAGRWPIPIMAGLSVQFLELAYRISANEGEMTPEARSRARAEAIVRSLNAELKRAY